MPQRRRWTELIPGLLAFGILIAVAVGVFLFAQVNSLHGKTARLFVATNSVRGVLPGTQVWLDGQTVGLVRRLDFRPPTAEPAHRMLISIEVLAHYLPGIRLDSRTQIRSGNTIIASPVVYISSGTGRSRSVRDGDTLYATAQPDMEAAASEFALGSKEFPAIIANIRIVGAALQSTKGTLGALGIEQGGSAVAVARTRSSRLMAYLSADSGTVGLTLRDSQVMGGGVQRTLAAADSLQQFMTNGAQSFGRFRRDSTLTATVAQLQRQLSDLSVEAARQTSTAGRLLADSALAAAIAAAQRRLNALSADLQKHPFRYIYF